MEQSNRDRILAMLLPAILVGVGYFLFFNEQKSLDEGGAPACKRRRLPPSVLRLWACSE